MARGKPVTPHLPPVILFFCSHLRGRLWLQVVVGLVLGVVVGLLLSPDVDFVAHAQAERIAAWLALPGRLFIAAIKFVVVPLIAAAVILGVAAGGTIAQLRKLGAGIVIYFLMTTSAAVALGSAMSYLIQPGKFVERPDATTEASGQRNIWDSGEPKKPTTVPQAIVGFIPENPYETLVAGDMLDIVIAAVIFGIALTALPIRNRRPILDLLESTQTASMVIVMWVMRFAPLAVFGLLAQTTARVGISAITGVAAYVMTVFLGLLGLFAMYLLLIAIFGRLSPILFMRDIREVILMAFSTSSSAATMPLTLRTAEEKLGVSPQVARFVVPLGTTINMDGTALYQAAAAIFLAQVYGVDIGVQGILVVLLTSIGASIGTPGTPGVGVVVLATILASVGIPEAGIALILGVDRIIDMVRTVINVTGDLTASVMMGRFLSHRFPQRKR